MSFPTSPTNGQIAVVNNIAYEYATANSSWTRVLSIANVIQANVISANILSVVQAYSVTGNITTGNYFIGNGAFLTGIASGNSNYSNANVAAYLPTYTGNLVSLTGPVTTTANITANNVLFGTGVVSGTGTVYAATVSTTGNVNSGYLSTGPAAVGNLISGGFVSASGNITGSYIFGNGALLTGVITSVSNINNGTSNVTVVSSGGNVTVGVGGTSNVAVFATTGEYVTGVISASGNITGGNVISGGVRVYKWTTVANTAPSGAVPGDNWYDSYADKLYLYVNDGTGNTWVDQSFPTTFANLSVTGNVTGGNLLTGGLISATGNITGGNLSGTNIVGTLTTAAQTNITAVGTLGSLTVTANTTSGNLLTGGLISSTGNITGGNILGGANVNATTHTGTTVSVTANVTGGNLLTGGLISAAGNITGGNLTAGTLTLSGNTISSSDTIITIDPAASGNTGGVIIQGNLSVTGNVTYIDSNTITTNDLVINMANNAATAAAANGGGIGVGPVTGAYATITYNSTGNIWVISNGANVSGAISATGNITGGNILGGANVNATTHTGTTVSVTANITGGNILTGGLISATGNITGGNLSGTSIVGTLTTAAQTNITSVGTLGSLTVTANTTSGNLLTGGLISAAGNITGGNILGGANVNATTHTGTTVSVTGNITGGNLAVTGSLNATKSGGTLSILTQTSATGYGLTIIPGADTVYDAFTINNATNTLNQIQMFGNGNAIFKGNVGVGTSSPSYRFQVYNNTDGFISRFTGGTASNVNIGVFGSTGSSFGSIGTESNHQFRIFTNGVDRAIIDTGGNLSVTGDVIGYASSDKKFKTNIRPIPNALSAVEHIGGKLFDWTDEYMESVGQADGYFRQKEDFGIVAQDVQKVFPLAVRTRPDGSLAVDYVKLSALAFASIAELSAKLKDLEGKINDLTSRT